MQKEFEEGKFYVVHWEDPFSLNTGWTSIDNIEKGASKLMIQTVGQCALSLEDRVVMSLSTDVDNNKFTEIMVIPHRTIDSVQQLSINKAKRPTGKRNAV